MRVQRFADRMGIGLFLDVDMRDLAERMYAGIGTPRSVHAGLLSAEPGYGLLDTLLDRRTVILALPACIGAAIVFDGQFPAGHERTVPTGAGLPRT